MRLDERSRLLHSYHFRLEWPPKSGRQQEFPEVDRAAWVSPDEARGKMHTGQPALLDRLLELLEDRAG